MFGQSSKMEPRCSSICAESRAPRRRRKRGMKISAGLSLAEPTTVRDAWCPPR
jgi:hypothetical protein